MLLRGCASLGRVDGFPVMNSERFCLNGLIFLRLFLFSYHCTLNIFLEYTPNLSVFGMSFQVGKDSTDIANSKFWPFIPKGSF